MREPAKDVVEQLSQFKKTVEQSYEYFRDNIDRYNDFMRFVFKTSMSDDDVNVLDDLGKPNLEFNILESQVSRLRGEFAKQQPSLTVRAADGVPLQMLTPQFTKTIDVIEAHLRAIFFDGSNDMLEYNIYSDLLAGGFSVMEVYTDYVNEMSFEQNIFVDRAFDPTLCGFDPLARKSHKGDGRFCFQLYPRTEEQFIEEFGKEALEGMSFTKNVQGFGWSFRNQREKIILVCDLWQKVRKRASIIKLSNGAVVTTDEYKKFLKRWEELGRIEQPPAPVGDSRSTYIERIERTRFCETKVLKHEKTNFKHLPLVFVDGNSVFLNEADSSSQITRPYVYHAKGIQQLKNFAGQTLANELENMVQHKFKVAIESIPEDYLSAYQNVQKADVLLYNHFYDKTNPEITLPPPTEIVRPPIPPEVTNTFRLSDEMTQTILGTVDGNQLASAQLSGVAVARTNLMGNNASIPYIVGYIKGLNRVAEIIVDLIPKYYRTPRSLPVLLPDGTREYFVVNKQGSLWMNYDPNSIQVKVEAGVNFAMQKEIALQTITTLMQSSPLFAQFINTYGLQVILDNIDIRGIDALKQKAAEFEQQMEMERKQAMAAQAQQAQMQQQLQGIAMQKAVREAQGPTDGEIAIAALQEKSVIDKGNLAIKQRDSDRAFIETLAKIRGDEVENELKAEQIDAENMRSSVDMAISLSAHMNGMAKPQGEQNAS